MSSPACGNCHFFDDHHNSPNSENGLCRYNPPAAKSNTESAWPVVARKDWCGHFAVTADRFMTAAE